MTATVHDQFIGVADETAYGTAVAPDTFYEIVEESVNPDYQRIESAAIRGPILRADRFAPNPKGAAGDITIDVLDKGVDFWLKHMLGDVTTTGDGTTAPIVATAVPGPLEGKSFTCQIARYGSGVDALVPFNYLGGKVASWELDCDVDGVAQLKLTTDFATEDVDNASGNTPLATVVYPAGAQMMTFIGGDVKIGGVEFAVKSVALTGDNGLKVDRYAMRAGASTTKREPKEASLKAFTFKLTGEFEDSTQSARVASLTAAGVLAEVTLHFDSPQGGALDITCPAARFDVANANAQRDIADQELDGVLTQPTDGSAAISVVYTSVL